MCLAEPCLPQSAREHAALAHFAAVARAANEADQSAKCHEYAGALASAGTAAESNAAAAASAAAAAASAAVAAAAVAAVAPVVAPVVAAVPTCSVGAVVAVLDQALLWVRLAGEIGLCASQRECGCIPLPLIGHGTAASLGSCPTPAELWLAHHACAVAFQISSVSRSHPLLSLLFKKGKRGR